MPAADFAVQELVRAVRNVPDFPKPGIQFKDITPILSDPHLLRQAVDVLVQPYRDQGITKVVGIESRGFILGGLLARELDAGFVPVRKRGKLPYETLAVEYDLEYGTDWIEMHVDALAPGDRVLMAETGQFATLWQRLATRLGLEVDFIPGDWRHGADAAQIEARLKEDKAHAIKAVCVVHNETSTGVTSRIPLVRKALDQPPAR